jgi:hypothetical protein
MDAGQVKGFAVDASVIEADASRQLAARGGAHVREAHRACEQRARTIQPNRVGCRRIEHETVFAPRLHLPERARDDVLSETEAREFRRCALQRAIRSLARAQHFEEVAAARCPVSGESH